MSRTLGAKDLKPRKRKGRSQEIIARPRILARFLAEVMSFYKQLKKDNVQDK